MSKHIVDTPRSRNDAERLARFTKLDKTHSGKPGAQSEALSRAKRPRDPGEKLRRYTELDRQD